MRSFIYTVMQLVDTKGATSTTLLHFLVDTVETSFPKVLGFLEQLKDCEEAAKGIDTKNIRNTIA